MPISNRPSARTPGENSAPTPRIATKADAHAKSVNATRASRVPVARRVSGTGGAAMLTARP